MQLPRARRIGLAAHFVGRRAVAVRSQLHAMRSESHGHAVHKQHNASNSNHECLNHNKSYNFEIMLNMTCLNNLNLGSSVRLFEILKIYVLKTRRYISLNENVYQQVLQAGLNLDMLGQGVQNSLHVLIFEIIGVF